MSGGSGTVYYDISSMDEDDITEENETVEIKDNLFTDKLEIFFKVSNESNFNIEDINIDGMCNVITYQNIINSKTYDNKLILEVANNIFNFHPLLHLKFNLKYKYDSDVCYSTHVSITGYTINVFREKKIYNVTVKVPSKSFNNEQEDYIIPVYENSTIRFEDEHKKINMRTTIQNNYVKKKEPLTIFLYFF